MTSKFMQVEEALRKITIAKLDKMRRDVVSNNEYKEDTEEPSKFIREMEDKYFGPALEILEKSNLEFSAYGSLDTVKISLTGVIVSWHNMQDYSEHENVVYWEELK